MEEYYCPNCGAVLNDQDGFDPDSGTWTCTECGEFLMDDDIYSGDAFDGVAWFCDECGALLNRQSGFSDSCGRWTCEECGHVNGITEDDIDDDDDDDSIKCPHCGANLNDQCCYSEYNNDWECSECGSHLHREFSNDDYEVVYAVCPKCDADLFEQSFFSISEDDWVCDECGAHLHRGYFSEEYELVEDNDCEDDDEENSQESYNNASASRNNDSESSQTKSRSKNLTSRLSKDDLRKIRAKAFILHLKKITVGIDSKDFCGQDLNAVQTALYNRAFNNLKTHLLQNDNDTFFAKDTVDHVSIRGKKHFSANDTFSYSSKVVIYYHEKHKIKSPFSSHSFKKIGYTYALNQLNEIGFTNVRCIPLHDLKLGWFKHDFCVDKIMVENLYPLKKGKIYNYDIPLKLYYHSFK